MECLDEKKYILVEIEKTDKSRFNLLENDTLQNDNERIETRD
ncbi:MAG: hypothetical protein ACRCVT_04445 [Leadbetterella sp.]